MNEPPTHSYTEFHPKWYRRRLPINWWMERRSYLLFMLRELSSLFIFYFALLTLVQLYALGRGPQAYTGLEAWLRTPLALVLNALSLGFVIYHAVTWFNLAPKALVVKMGGKPVPPLWIAGSNYLAWLLASVVVAWVLIGG